MSCLSVTCVSCHRSWKLAVDASPYLLLDLTSRPCPFCEAGTLSCLDAEGVESPPRRSRAAGGSARGATRKKTYAQRQMDP